MGLGGFSFDDDLFVTCLVLDNGLGKLTHAVLPVAALNERQVEKEVGGEIEGEIEPEAGNEEPRDDFHLDLSESHGNNDGKEGKKGKDAGGVEPVEGNDRGEGGNENEGG